jgi:hypothetical protein
MHRKAPWLHWVPMNDYFVMALLLGLPGLGALWIGVRAWTGRSRKWAPRHVSLLASPGRNYEPLQLGLVGILALLAMVPLTATLERWESAGMMWTVFAVISVLAVVVARFWWPHWLTRAGTRTGSGAAATSGNMTFHCGAPPRIPGTQKHRIDSWTL